MSVKKHEPLIQQPSLMSPEKRDFWSATWPARPSPKAPRMAVLFYAVSATMRPTARDETVLHGYVSLNKFHDREPELVLKAIESLDPAFFDDYPRKPGTGLTAAFKKAAIGEAARQFFRFGMAFDPPDFRKRRRGTSRERGKAPGPGSAPRLPPRRTPPDPRSGSPAGRIS